MTKDFDTADSRADELGGAAKSDAASASDVDLALWRQLTSARTLEEFSMSWLALQCRQIRDVGDAVLVLGKDLNDAGSAYTLFEPTAFWPDGQRDRRHLASVTERAISECGPVIVEGETDGENGRRRFHLAQPITVDSVLHGVVALNTATDSEADVRSILRQLQWGTAWLELIRRRDGQDGATGLRDSATRPSLAPGRLHIVLGLVGTLLRHDRFQAAATAFVTEIATRVECDRVSVGFARGEKVRLRAVSHSAQFGKKTNLTRAVEAAMAESLEQYNVIVYPERPDAQFQIKKEHDKLAHEHGSGAICSIPLPCGDQVIGVLTLERRENRPFDASTIEFCEALAAVSGPILELERKDDRLLIIRARDSARDFLRRLVGPRHLVLKVTTAFLTALVVFFAVVQWDYRIAADTVLEGLVQRVATAPFDGYVADAPARAGDVVRKGDVLCTLDDRDLKLERVRLQSQSEQIMKQRRQAAAERNAAAIKVLSSQLDGVKAQLDLVDQQLSRMKVEAGIDGIVVSGDLSQAIGAPVKRGDVLYEIATLQRYRVILQVDEGDVDEIEIGQVGEVVFTAFPTESLSFEVSRVTPVSATADGVNYFRVEAELTGASGRLRPGMEGLGKITVARRHLIWIWTRKAFDWMRLFFWKWTP